MKITPLLAAIGKQNAELVRLLLDGDADVTILDNSGEWDALKIAIAAGHKDIISLLTQAMMKQKKQIVMTNKRTRKKRNIF